MYKQYLDAEPYADPERREQLRLDASKNEQHNVSYYDVTFSVPKSITVLHAAFEAQEVKARRAGNTEAAEAWAAHRQAIEDAIWAGNNAALDYLAEKAGYSRIGHHGGGAGRFIDAHDWTVASFFQHTSRDERSAAAHPRRRVLPRAVRGRDVAHAGRQEPLQPQARRRRGRGPDHVRARRAQPARAGRDAPGRQDPRASRHRPGSQRSVLRPAAHDQPQGAGVRRARSRSGTAANRPRWSWTGCTGRPPCAPARASPTTAKPSNSAWNGGRPQIQAELSIGLDKVAHDVLAFADREPVAQTFDPEAVIEIALADVQAKKASWRKADLARAVNDALPDYLGGLSGADVAELIDGLTDQAIAKYGVPLSPDGPAAESLPADLRLADGRSVYERAGERKYATGEHVRSERALRAAAVERTTVRVTPELAAAFFAELAESGIELGVDQAAAVRGVLTSGAAWSRWSARPGPARASWSAPSRTPGPTPPCGAASSAACSGSPRRRSRARSSPAKA